jgi:DNA-binding PadR family transcriptional regulator
MHISCTIQLQDMRTSPSAFAPITPLTYHLLAALYSGPLHAYAIKAAITRNSGISLTPTSGSIHHLLISLIDRKYIEKIARTSDTSSANLYQITPFGLQAFELELDRLKRDIAIGTMAQKGLLNR